jgi:hypothetical protein
MKPIESLQSNAGQLIAGVGIPFTETDVSIPEIPFKDVGFDNNLLAVSSVAVIGAGITYGTSIYRKSKKAENSKHFTQGDSTKDMAYKPIRNQFRRGVVGVIAVTGALTGFMLDRSGPHTEESVNTINKLAIVIDAGYESLATDVEDNGSDITRIEAAVNGLALDKNTLSNLIGIDTTFFAAGADPRVMGAISAEVTGSERTEAKATIIKNFKSYFTPSQYGTENNGGGDIAQALSLAESVKPNKTIVVTGTMRGHEQSPILVGENLEGVNNVIVIAIGQPGSEVDLANGKAKAPIEPKFNEKIVGEDDSHMATSMDELEDVVKHIVDTEIVNNVRSDYEGYRNLAAVSGALGIGVLGYSLHKMSGIRPIKRTKMVINSLRKNK